ncbi:hypothetical protein CAG54_05030 [Vibrio sp. V27_P1S3P104]|uniref:hypothetical protein n=1 Tax=Vibrio TaxID=662 RepID=UPI00130010F2|nr:MULTISPECIES: hypothetical protein [Vibrio]NAW69671.1 hypothetical protein [Vibrio sp. V28_P6S34P95]NAX05452.1 hypothetical protein [Vibrio sp. V30_P3S12P165]NAX35263.1 hypothetical protein [Vibrio sp. V29_P1S30P107]NAX36886.1 hypothetical protein [Vibrio sp. V27_P1S3P104]NAX40668.1 hypothetical protein [Vibrio sp. V26_P1S5P106]
MSTPFSERDPCDLKVATKLNRPNHMVSAMFMGHAYHLSATPSDFGIKVHQGLWGESSHT